MKNFGKILCGLLACLLGSSGLVSAQLLGPYGTSPITFGVDSNGLLSATGTYGGSGSLSLSGAGTRMFWYPQKAAFRAGYVSGSDWNDTNIGAYSTAFGQDTMASNPNSFAAGSLCAATGWNSIALGYASTASGNQSMAVCSGTATGLWSMAFSASTASGIYSISMGLGVTASGNYSVAMGYNSSATGIGSMATGYGTSASGDGATAIGNRTSANGSYSCSLGYSTLANAYDSFVTGQFNVGGGSTSSWTSTDPLFEVGNGSDSSHPNDALVVYKNGNMQVGGVISAQPGGDIPMFTGN